MFQSEAAVRRYSLKSVFLKILLYSQENTMLESEGLKAWKFI